MAIATFRGEKNIGEITDKLFSRLTPKQRKRVEVELLKANPQLRDIKKLKKGTVLRVPKIPELKAKTNRSLENPDDQIAQDLSEALDTFGEYMKQRFEVAQDSVKQQIKLTKSAQFKKGISDSEVLIETASEAVKALDVRSKKIASQIKDLNSLIPDIIKDIENRLL